MVIGRNRRCKEKKRREKKTERVSDIDTGE